MKFYTNTNCAFIFLFSIIFLNGCNQGRFTSFHSDEELISAYQAYKTDFNKLIRKCESEKNLQKFKENINIKFTVCDLNKEYLSNTNLKEVSVQYKDSKLIFTTDQYKSDSPDVFLEEKGYLYTKDSIEDNDTKNLDQFNGKVLLKKQGIAEIWKYRKISPQWYLYYRQYFRVFLN